MSESLSSDCLSKPATFADTATGTTQQAVQMPAELYVRLLFRAQELNAAGLKAYGLLVGDPRLPGFPFRAVDLVVLDPHRNRRNEPGNRAAFQAQGSYFRAYEDAGFVADPIDLLLAWQRIERAGWNRSPRSMCTAASRPTSPASTTGCTTRLSPGT